MPTEVINKSYCCNVCKGLFLSCEDAARCEAQPVTQDKGVKVGDTVLITQGDGTGKREQVVDVSIIMKDWGHYQWRRYWHTVGLEVKSERGSRFLTFDNYEV